jgi:hypothetical protein
MSISVQDVDDLQVAATDPHARAAEALEHRRHAAVAWCSAHLAAADRVLYQAARRHVADGRRRTRLVRAVDHRLQQALCRLDRRLMGDVRLDQVPVAVLVEQVRQALTAHAEAERDVVEALQAVLAPEQQQELAHRLAAAMATAPTRPHPHTRHTPLTPVVGWFDALVDRVRDAMDNRVDPTGRPGRAVCPPGRWGCYLMGVPYPDERTGRKP